MESNQVRGDVCPLGEETVNRSLVIDSCSAECVYTVFRCVLASLCISMVSAQAHLNVCVWGGFLERSHAVLS